MKKKIFLCFFRVPPWSPYAPAPLLPIYRYLSSPRHVHLQTVVSYIVASLINSTWDLAGDESYNGDVVVASPRTVLRSPPSRFCEAISWKKHLRSHTLYHNCPKCLPKWTPFTVTEKRHLTAFTCTESSNKMDGIWNRYNLKSTRRIYTFGVLKCSKSLKFWTYLSTFQYMHRL